MNGHDLEYAYYLCQSVYWLYIGNNRSAGIVQIYLCDIRRSDKACIEPYTPGLLLNHMLSISETAFLWISLLL